MCRFSGEPLWHERMVLWPVSGATFVILTPDGDVYAEIVAGGDVEEEPEACHAVRRDGSLPNVARGGAYRFRARPDDEDRKKQFRAGLATARAQLQALGLEPPVCEKVIDSGGTEKDINEFYGGAFVRRRIQGKQGIIGGPAPQAAAGVGAGGLPAAGPVLPLQAVDKDGDHVWLAMEENDNVNLGEEIAVSAQDLTCGDNGLLLSKGPAIRIRRVLAKDAPEVIKDRTDEIKRMAGAITPKLPGLEDDRGLKELRATMAKGSLPADPGAVSSSPDDVRTLAVDYDSHGKRHKDWRDVCAESHIESFSDWPVEGPPTCLTLMKHMDKHVRSPSGWLE